MFLFFLSFILEKGYFVYALLIKARIEIQYTHYILTCIVIGNPTITHNNSKPLLVAKGIVPNHRIMNNCSGKLLQNIIIYNINRLVFI